MREAGSERKRIALVIPTFSIGGMERVMSELANYFYKRNNDVYVVFLVKHQPAYTVNKNIQLIFPTFEYGEPGEFRPWYWLRIIQYLRKNIKKINPDTVFSIPQDYSNITILSLLGTKYPVFISDRNSPNLPVPFFKRQFRRFCYPRASGIIAQTEYAKKRMIENRYRNKNIKVIPNPLKKINNHVSKLPGKRIIINIGRLVFEKNQSELINIFSEINDSDWLLHIVGDGPLKSELQAQITKLNLEEKVFLIGQVEDVDYEMAKAQIFAFTSIYEGFPNSLIEAMGFPLACISYDCIAGPSDIIEDGVNGFLIPFKNKELFRNKLKQLMDDEELRNQLKSKSIELRNKLSIEKIGDEYLKFMLSKKK